MPAVAAPKNKVENAFYVFQQLNEKEQNILYKKIKTKILIDNAKKIESFGEPIEMSMEEIVAETKEARKISDLEIIKNIQDEFSKYANPDLIPLEKEAWAMHCEKEYGNP